MSGSRSADLVRRWAGPSSLVVLNGVSWQGVGALAVAGRLSMRPRLTWCARPVQRRSTNRVLTLESKFASLCVQLPDSALVLDQYCPHELFDAVTSRKSVKVRGVSAKAVFTAVVPAKLAQPVACHHNPSA